MVGGLNRYAIVNKDMTVRPQIDEAVVDRLNEEMRNRLKVDPERLGVGEKIDILLDDLEEERTPTHQRTSRSSGF